jgi:hypothetical protein
MLVQFLNLLNITWQLTRYENYGRTLALIIKSVMHHNFMYILSTISIKMFEHFVLIVALGRIKRREKVEAVA